MQENAIAVAAYMVFAQAVIVNFTGMAVILLVRNNYDKS